MRRRDVEEEEVEAGKEVRRKEMWREEGRENRKDIRKRNRKGFVRGRKIIDKY